MINIMNWLISNSIKSSNLSPAPFGIYSNVSKQMNNSSHSDVYIFIQENPITLPFAVRGIAFFKLIEQIMSINNAKGTQM